MCVCIMLNVCFMTALWLRVQSNLCRAVRPFIAASETTSTKATMELRELGLVMRQHTERDDDHVAESWPSTFTMNLRAINLRYVYCSTTGSYLQ